MVINGKILYGLMNFLGIFIGKSWFLGEWVTQVESTLLLVRVSRFSRFL